MSTKRKKPRQLSSYVKHLWDIAQMFIKETGADPGCLDTNALAFWAYKKKHLEPQQRDVIKQLAREFSRAFRQQYIVDENGEPVRRVHAYRERRGDVQNTFWFMMEEATPQKMRLSAGARRRGALSDVMQIYRDLKYFNKNHNAGDPVGMSFNFDMDIAEKELPTEYPEEAPPEDKDD
jgi:hypothetical protein